MFSHRFVKAASIMVVAALLSACNAHTGPKQTGGTLIGAGVGGLIGSKFGRGDGKLAAVAVGTLLGAVVGNRIGASLDEADRRRAQYTAATALEHSPSGRTSTWHNPDSGNSGTFAPTRTYQTRSGRYCREYQQTITVGGRTERGYGTACRQPDGSWKITDAT